MLPLSLQPNPTPPREFEFIGFDTEGDGSLDGFRLAATYGADGPHIFTDRTQIADHLFRARNRGKRIVAANLEYDWAVAFQPFDEHHEPIITGSKWLQANYRDGHGHTFIAWDIQRIAPLSVEQMGDLIGVPKYATPPELKRQRDYAPESWTCRAHQREWCVECYCVRDAEIVYRFALWFQRILNRLGGQMKPTTASCAMDLFTRRFLHDEIAPSFVETNDRARAAYFGGRVETYRVGTTCDVTTFDFNSGYASVYRDIEVGDPATYHRITTPATPQRFLDKFGMMQATVKVPRSYSAPLPLHVGSKTVFATDRIEGTWVLAELRNAIENGASIEACEFVVYADRTLRLFRNYVDVLYGLRRRAQEKGSPDQYVYKVLLNGLYGKFGQRSDDPLKSLIVPRGKANLSDFEDCEPVDVCGYEGFLVDKVARVQSPHVHVLWAAAISAGMRLKLHELIEHLDGNVFYCDTDSVVTTARLRQSNDLGGLKIAERFDKATFFAPKEYIGVTLEGHQIARVKGVPPHLAEEYLRTGSTAITRPIHTLTAVRHGGRIAEWKTVVKRKLASPPTRYHRAVTNYARQCVNTRPYCFAEALDALG
jgi:hypothetical protein